MPGMTLWPDPSTTVAPSGIAVVREGPTAAIAPPRMTSV
jgi:hypothetical protein